MVEPIHLLPRDEPLDPLSMTSIGEWVERHRPHLRSRKAPRAHARAIAQLLHRLWPGLDEAADARSITLSDPDASFSVRVGEDRVTIEVQASPEPDRIGEKLATAIAEQTGWLAYDPQRQDIIAGVDWRCTTCHAWFAVRHAHCPTCRGEPDRASVTWVEPPSVRPRAELGTAMELAPLLWLYDLTAEALVEAVAEPMEEALTRAVHAALDTRATIEVSLHRPSTLTRQIFDPIEADMAERYPGIFDGPPRLADQWLRTSTGLDVMLCVKVVQQVTDRDREIAIETIEAEFDDTELDDELLFPMTITPGAHERTQADSERYGFLPLSLWQPGLAKTIGATLRPMLGEVARRRSRSL